MIVELLHDSVVFPWKKGDRFEVAKSIAHPEWYCISGSGPWGGQHIKKEAVKIIKQ